MGSSHFSLHPLSSSDMYIGFLKCFFRFMCTPRVRSMLIIFCSLMQSPLVFRLMYTTPLVSTCSLLHHLSLFLRTESFSLSFLSSLPPPPSIPPILLISNAKNKRVRTPWPFPCSITSYCNIIQSTNPNSRLQGLVEARLTLARVPAVVTRGRPLRMTISCGDLAAPEIFST